MSRPPHSQWQQRHSNSQTWIQTSLPSSIHCTVATDLPFTIHLKNSEWASQMDIKTRSVAVETILLRVLRGSGCCCELSANGVFWNTIGWRRQLMTTQGVSWLKRTALIMRNTNSPRDGDERPWRVDQGWFGIVEERRAQDRSSARDNLHVTLFAVRYANNCNAEALHGGEEGAKKWNVHTLLCLWLFWASCIVSGVSVLVVSEQYEYMYSAYQTNKKKANANTHLPKAHSRES